MSQNLKRCIAFFCAVRAKTQSCRNHSHFARNIIRNLKTTKCVGRRRGKDARRRINLHPERQVGESDMSTDTVSILMMMIIITRPSPRMNDTRLSILEYKPALASSSYEMELKPAIHPEQIETNWLSRTRGLIILFPNEIENYSQLFSPNLKRKRTKKHEREQHQRSEASTTEHTMHPLK